MFNVQVNENTKNSFLIEIFSYMFKLVKCKLVEIGNIVSTLIEIHCRQINCASTTLHFLFYSGSRLRISIEYSTSKTASAVQWLKPEQTAGKKHPYMFTQCQVRFVTCKCSYVIFQFFVSSFNEY